MSDQISDTEVAALIEENDNLRNTVSALIEENNHLRVDLAKALEQLKQKKRRSMFDPPIRESERIPLARNAGT